MRAAEFMRALADIIDKLDGKGAETQQPVDPSKPLDNPVFVSPLQQELELAKADQGKDSPVIDKITADDDIGEEPPNPIFRTR
jgi:hypothetical protein